MSDLGYLALDNSKRPVLYGMMEDCLNLRMLKPLDGTASQITGNTGTNSFQISDLAGTNVSLPSGLHTSLYFTTQDNAIWASPDGGFTWPNSEGPEGSLLQVRKDASSDSEVTVAYVRVTPDPLQNQRFSGANLVNPRNIRNMDTTGDPCPTGGWLSLFHLIIGLGLGQGHLTCQRFTFLAMTARICDGEKEQKCAFSLKAFLQFRTLFQPCHLCSLQRNQDPTRWKGNYRSIKTYKYV